MYSVQEKVFWIQSYFKGLSFREVCDEFHEQYPDRPKPHHSTVKRCFDRFKETGSVNYERTGNHNQQENTTNETMVLTSASGNPCKNTSKIAKGIGLSQPTIWRNPHKYGPCKIQTHQELKPSDREKRVEFAAKAIEISAEDPDFIRNIIFTDETTFTLHHTPNRQNTRKRSRVNPRKNDASHTQYSNKVNLWLGIVNHCLIGPIIIDGALNGPKYLELLENEIGIRLADLDLGKELWYLHDGCSAHNYRPAVDFLRKSFPGRVIGTYEQPLTWPTRSPDLNPLEFFLWGHISSTIYKDGAFADVQSLQLAIEECCANITYRQLEAVNSAFFDRLGYCVTANGGIFEHLI